MLSSNPSQLYVQSRRTIWCLLCETEVCWIVKIALKPAWLSHGVNLELLSAAAYSAQEMYQSRATLDRLEDRTPSELHRKKGSSSGKRFSQFLHS